MFGDKLLAEKMDELHYSVDTPTVRLFRIDNENLAIFKAKLDNYNNTMVVDGLLRELIPDYSTSSRTNRDLLVSAFKLQEFCTGVDIIKEGKPCFHAYIVVDGEVVLTKKSKLPGLAPDYGQNVNGLCKMTAN